jgi:oligopeptide/dipeptide ABC transporter ATP-binding protein
MYSGSLCEIAKADDLFATPIHPYTKALLAALPKPNEEPHPIRGSSADPLNPPAGCHFHPRCFSASEICQRCSPLMREAAPGHFVACHQ